ncbi:MAG: class I lanthipeptide, partial [Kofleriaceae bacterium]
MKKTSRKLNLNRETLIPLQNDEMNAINGGATPTITTSSAACTASIASVLSAISQSLNSRWCK